MSVTRVKVNVDPYLTFRKHFFFQAKEINLIEISSFANSRIFGSFSIQLQSYLENRLKSFKNYLYV